MTQSMAAYPPGVAEQSAQPARRVRTSGRRNLSAAIGFLAPFLTVFVAFYIVPIGYAVFSSFQKIEREGTFGEPRSVFGGLSQYTQVVQNPDFWNSVANVGKFFVVSVPIQLGLALLFALLLDGPYLKGKRFFRLTFFAPYAVPGVIAALTWGFLYMPGLTPFPGLVDRFALLGPDLILYTMANVVNWVFIGYNMLIIYSALQAVPREVVEAATVDGAGQVRIAWSVKIPHVLPALVLTGVFSIIGTLQLFNEPQIFRGLSSAVDSNYTPNMVVYSTLNIPNYHLAAAYSVVLALITCVLSFTFLRLARRRAFQ